MICYLVEEGDEAASLEGLRHIQAFVQTLRGSLPLMGPC